MSIWDISNIYIIGWGKGSILVICNVITQYPELAMFRRFQVSDVVSFELGVMVLDNSNCKDMLVCIIRANV